MSAQINPAVAQRIQQARNTTYHRVDELLGYLAKHGINAQWLEVEGNIVAEETLLGEDGQVYTELVWLKPTAQDVRAFLGY